MNEDRLCYANDHDVAIGHRGEPMNIDPAGAENFYNPAQQSKSWWLHLSASRARMHHLGRKLDRLCSFGTGDFLYRTD